MPAPKFYGQPKIPKPGVLIRPIVSQSGSPLYNLNKYVANILKPYVKDENNNAKNSTTFLRIFLTTSEMLPLKMTRKLYHLTSLPCTWTIDTLNLIKDYVNNDYQFTRKTAIP